MNRRKMVLYIFISENVTDQWLQVTHPSYNRPDGWTFPGGGWYCNQKENKSAYKPRTATKWLVPEIPYRTLDAILGFCIIILMYLVYRNYVRKIIGVHVCINLPNKHLPRYRWQQYNIMILVYIYFSFFLDIPLNKFAGERGPPLRTPKFFSLLLA